MPRCVLPALAVLSALAVPLPAAAQLPRPFPADALRGTIEVTQPPEILLNGQTARLSPGARIRAENNMLVLSGALVGQPLVVHYTFALGGGVHQVWILRPEERAREPWPTTPEQAQRWSFDAAAQTWTRR